MKSAIFILFLFVLNNLCAQKYQVELVLKNESSVSDICPTIYEDGIIFMSNEKSEYLRTVKDVTNQYPYHLYFQQVDSNKIKGQKKRFAEEIASLYNDGPLNAYAENKKIVFSKNNRNSSVKKRSQSETIGIYFSEKIDGTWSNPEPFEYNNSEYNLTHPTITSDGSLLVFSSAKDADKSGMDLYYSTYSDNKWSSPTKFESKINTPGNEVYPTIVGNRIYYSTNGKNDSTGLDIWSFRFENNTISSLIKLDSAINSKHDDFGVAFRSDLTTGYFTSNRDGSDQIYFFEKKRPTLDDCPKQKKISFCYLIEEHNMLDESGMPLKFTWDLGDGNTKEGYRIKHCYDTLGQFTAKLNILDTVTGDVFKEISEVTININTDPTPRIIFTDTLAKDQLTQFNADPSYVTYVPDEIIWQVNQSKNQFFGNSFHEKSVDRDSIEIKLGFINGNDLQCVSKTFFFKERKNSKTPIKDKQVKKTIINRTLDSTKNNSINLHKTEGKNIESSIILKDTNSPKADDYVEFKQKYENTHGNLVNIDELYLLYLEMNDLGYDSELINKEIETEIERRAEQQNAITIYFGVSTDEITPFNEKNIQNFLSLKGTEIEFNIFGFADPTVERNKELSLKRANSVEKQLIELGVSPNNITVRGMGEMETTTEENQLLKLLRKVEVEIKN